MVKTTRKKLKALKEKVVLDNKKQLEKKLKRLGKSIKSVSENNEDGVNIKNNDNEIKNENSNLNTKSSSKVLKRMKYTLKKLNLDTDKIVETLKSIKAQNKALNEKLENKIYHNIFLYINFKNPIEENFKNKLFKLPNSIINPTNNLKIILVSNEITNNNLFNDNTISMTNKFENIEEHVECLKEEHFVNMVKEVKFKDNLNYLYRMIVSDNKFNFKLQKTVTKKTYKKLDTLNLNINNTAKGKLYIKTILKNIYTGGLMKKLNDNIFSMKVANCGMTLEEIFKNVKVEIYKLVSEILERSDKHNK